MPLGAKNAPWQAFNNFQRGSLSRIFTRIYRTYTYLSRIWKPRDPRFKEHLFENRQAKAKMGQVNFEHFA